MARIGTLFFLILFLASYFGAFQFWFGLTRPQEINLVIAVTVSFLWVTEFVPLFVTGFLVLFLELFWLIPFWGEGAPKPIVFLSCFFSETILLFLGGFVISAAISKFQLDRDIANFVIKKTAGSAFLLILSLGFVTAFLSCFMNNTATAAMMLGLVSSFMKTWTEDHPLRKSLLFLIPFSANLGGIGTPIGTLPNVIGIGYLKERGLDFGFLSWMGFALPIVFVSILILCLLIYFIYLRKMSTNSLELKIVEDSYFHSLKEKWISISVIGVTVLGWITYDLHKIPNGTVAIIPILCFFGFRMLTLHDFRSLPWEVLILMGGGIALGKAFEETGLASYFVNLFKLGDLGNYGLFVFFSLLSLSLSCFLSNTSTANLILPITMGLPSNLVLPAALGATIGASLAMPLPVSTPPNALAFSYGGITSREMLKIGSQISFYSWIVLVTIGAGLLYILGIVEF